MEKQNIKTDFIQIAIGISISLFCWFILFHGKAGQFGTVASDDYQNISYAYHMVKDRVFSAEIGGNAVTPNEYHPPVPLTPSGWREPGYPAFAALVFLIDRAFGGDNIDLLFNQNTLNLQHSSIATLQFAQITLLWAIGIVGGLLAWTIWKRPFFVVTVFVAIIFNPVLVDSAFSVGWLETLHAFLLCFVSYAFLQLLKKVNFFWALILGLSLGFLTLTSGLWLYFLPLATAMVGLVALKRCNRLIARICVILLTLISFIPPAAWMARNYYYFERAAISFKGGLVLDVRAEMTDISLQEYYKSFLYWSGSSTLSRLAAQMGSVERLETHGPESFFRKALDRRLFLNNETGRTSIADRLQAKEALEKIADKPVKHFLLIFPLSVRLMSQWFPFGILLIVCGIAFFIAEFKANNINHCVAIIPSLYLVVFLLLLSHCLPRYGSVLFPVLTAIGIPILFLSVRQGLVRYVLRGVAQ